MAKIDPQRLRAVREKRAWSLSDLAGKAKVNKQTIFRIEKGNQRATRPHTLKQLARALGVEEGVLLGDLPLPDIEARDEPEKSQLNVRVSNAARNAMFLAARRYSFVTPSDIVELAPYLFVWAAEASLRWRKQQLDTLEQAVKSAQRSSILYGAVFDDIENAIAEQEHSVAHRDVLGRWPVMNYANEHKHDGLWMGEEEDEGPFVEFLRHLTAEYGDMSFDRWYDRPEYRMCEADAAAIVGGDSDRAEEIVAGFAPLHELPAELRTDEPFFGEKQERTALRAAWVKKRAQEHHDRALSALVLESSS